MWAIYNKTSNKFWNSENKEWVTKIEATFYASYDKAEKEIKKTISNPNSILMIKPFLI